MELSFKDHFSAQANEYARYRPTYPAALFEWLAEIVPGRETAWDCATGNGQAAVALSAYFDDVVATDASKQQIANAHSRERVAYRVARSEESTLAANSCDLITVAQALHWFDHERFFAQCRRVAKPGAILACWCYNLLTISEKIDAIVNRLYFAVVGPYWPPERKLLEEHYQSISFPFEEVEAPSFQMTATWRLTELLGYLNTWSATQRFLHKNGTHPLEQIAPELRDAWGDEGMKRRVQWPLYLRAGRVLQEKSAVSSESLWRNS